MNEELMQLCKQAEMKKESVHPILLAAWPVIKALGIAAGIAGTGYAGYEMIKAQQQLKQQQEAYKDLMKEISETKGKQKAVIDYITGKSEDIAGDEAKLPKIIKSPVETPWYRDVYTVGGGLAGGGLGTLLGPKVFPEMEPVKARIIGGVGGGLGGALLGSQLKKLF